MKNMFYVMIMGATMIAMILIPSARGSAAMMPTDEFAGISIEKGTLNNVPYETGGVGIDERAAMQKSKKDYNLRLIFATTKGLYLASVPVQIKSRSGEVVLSMDSNGPFFWVKLPAGQYEVMATYNGKQEIHKVDVSAGHKKVEFTWKRAE
jgi:hypothetical protein